MGFGDSGLLALSQLTILLGAVRYAGNSVLTRILARGNDALAASAAILLLASLIAVSVTLWVDHPRTVMPTVSSAAVIIWLGVGPTALAAEVYFKLIASAGLTFTSLVNYMSPVVAVFLGVALLGEGGMACV
jgi:drug/metabolite transporter (DMT)-like permease